MICILHFHFQMAISWIQTSEELWNSDPMYVQFFCLVFHVQNILSVGILCVFCFVYTASSYCFVLHCLKVGLGQLKMTTTILPSPDSWNKLAKPKILLLIFSLNRTIHSKNKIPWPLLFYNFFLTPPPPIFSVFFMYLKRKKVRGVCVGLSAMIGDVNKTRQGTAGAR